jgi:acyl-CoA synthetase (AMP-forming)/AMP-acid ligase II
MIKTGGANVSPVEIERALDSCPGVHNGVAVGIPHPKLGEVIVLGVTPTEGTTLDPAAVRTFLRGKLSAYKIPKHVFIYSDDDLSFTASQKVQVAPLRKLVTERLVREGVEIDGHRYTD